MVTPRILRKVEREIPEMGEGRVAVSCLYTVVCSKLSIYSYELSVVYIIEILFYDQSNILCFVILYLFTFIFAVWKNSLEVERFRHFPRVSEKAQ